MRIKMICGLLGVILLLGPALASGVNIYFKVNGIKNESGGTLTDSNYHPYQARLQFYHNTNPAINTNPAKYDPTYVASQYTLTTTGYNKYQLSATNGGTMYIRVWKNVPSGDNKGNYYGKDSTGVSAGTVTAVEKSYDEFKTDYLADVPVNAPAWGSVSESSVRIGSSTDVKLSLSVGFSYSLGSPKIEATGYLVRFWKDGETDPGDGVTAPDSIRVFQLAGGDTGFSLPATDALTSLPFSSGVYHFKIRAFNVYGQGPWSLVKDWPTLSGGGGSLPLNFDLSAFETGKMIINSVSTSTDTTATAVKEAVNAKAGANVVTAVSYWDRLTGVSFTAAFDTSGALVTGSSDFIIKRGVGIQVYTTTAVSGLAL